MKNSRMMLVDTDPYTATLLLDELAQRGFKDVQLAANTLEMPRLFQDSQPDVVIFNYHSDKPDSLIVCGTIKLMAPLAALVAIVSPGPALKTVRAWAKQTKSIDVVIEKPLTDDRFFTTLRELLAVKETSRELTIKAERLSNLVPEGAMSVIESTHNNEAEIFEAAVLFTDIRGSSQLIQEIPPNDFFELLNRLLSEQAQQIHLFEGAVVKYTGDGVMAIFRGMGRSYLALSCALELAKLSSEQKMPFGIGVAQGLVLAGLIGDSSQAGRRRQYDVIGTTVHLAARLCSMANAGEVISTRSVNTAAKITTLEPKHIDNVTVRGFDQEISCVSFKSVP